VLPTGADIVNRLCDYLLACARLAPYEDSAIRGRYRFYVFKYRPEPRAGSYQIRNKQLFTPYLNRSGHLQADLISLAISLLEQFQ
jgi:hypothetical protein